MNNKLLHKWRSRFILPGFALVILLALSACGPSSTGTSGNSGTTSATTESSSGPQKVQVTEKDFSITLSTNTVSPGQVEFNLSNQGPSEHEFIIFKTDLAQDNLPTKNGIVDESASSLTKVYEQNQYAADTSKTATVNLDAGNYVVICNLPGHYQQGMHAALTVASGSSPSATTSSSSSGQESSSPTATPEAMSTTSASSSQSEAPTVGVIEKNYEIFVNRESVPAGVVTFNIRNEGTSDHEFVIFKTDLSSDSLPIKDAQVQENASNLEKVAEIPQFAPNETREISIELAAGHYVLLCNLPDHYQQGMHIDFTVSSPTSTPASPTPTPEPSQSTSQSMTKVSVLEKSYGIYLNRVMVPSGQVEFDLSNLGPDQHEFVIFKTDLAPDQLPVQNGQVVEDAASLQKIDEQQEYPSGDTRSLTAMLEPGNYVLICNIVGHYQQGMHVGFMVTDSSQDNSVSPVPESVDTVSVIEKNYGIYLNTSAVPAGQVTFDLSNLGPDQHEFVVFKTDLAADQLPVQNGQVVEDDPSLQKIDEQQQYTTDITPTLTVNLDPGHYVLICNLPGHYQQGMHISFTVVGSSSSPESNAETQQPASQLTSGTISAGKVSVIEASYQIFLNRSTVPSGQVEFDLANNGPDQHEFVVFKTDLAPDQLPVQNGQVVEDDPSLQKIGEQDQYPANENRILTLDLEPGHYVLICNLPGHYEKGMYYLFTVN